MPGLSLSVGDDGKNQHVRVTSPFNEFWFKRNLARTHALPSQPEVSGMPKEFMIELAPEVSCVLSVASRVHKK